MGRQVDQDVVVSEHELAKILRHMMVLIRIDPHRWGRRSRDWYVQRTGHELFSIDQAVEELAEGRAGWRIPLRSAIYKWMYEHDPFA